MTSDMIPEPIRRMYPYIEAEAWTALSEHRFRAEHLSRAVILVVSAFGETHGQGCSPDKETEVFARLIESCATAAAHRLACEEGTPVVRPDNEANRGVVGCCWWCGALAKQHGGPADAPVELPDDPLPGEPW